LANRMKHTFHDVLSASQYSGIKWRNIIKRHRCGRRQDATGNMPNGFGFLACIW
jgi:hypothetical protein